MGKSNWSGGNPLHKPTMALSWSWLSSWWSTLWSTVDTPQLFLPVPLALPSQWTLRAGSLYLSSGAAAATQSWHHIFIPLNLFINPTLKNIQALEKFLLNCVLCRRVHMHACVLGCVCTYYGPKSWYYGPKSWCQSCYSSYLRLVFLNEITIKADTLKGQSLNQTFHWKNLLRKVYVLRIPLVVH